MKVKAKPGVQVPREENPRRYVSDSEVLEVAETAYYLRRIADGDLERVTEAAPAADAPNAPAADAPKAPAAVKVPAAEAPTVAVKNEPEAASGDKGAK